METLRRFKDTVAVISELTPVQSLYCLSRAALAEQVDRFKQSFPGNTAYAVKANPEPALIVMLGELGINSFDVASLAEIEMVYHLVPGAKLLYDNPVKSRLEIERAYNEFGVCSFAVDDPIELRKLHDIIGGDANVEFTIRFKLPAEATVYDLTAKFGCEKSEAPALLKEAAGLGYKTGLTFHPGSQCQDPTAYGSYIDAAADIVTQAQINLDSLNIGGGLPIRYIGESIPALRDYFRVVNDQFKAHFDPAQTSLICEPGRALVDSSVSLLTRVKHRREDNNVFVNDGVYGAFMEQTLSPLVHPTRVFRDAQILDDKLEPFTVWGPTCDALDRLRHEPLLPASISEGDWIEFGLMGGYGSCTATQFNGFTSAGYVEVEEGFPYQRATLE